MRFSKILVAAAILFSTVAAQAASGRIIKLLPHYLDKDGKHTRSPSLYERDAYQAQLRSNPKLVSGIRFDVKWRASDVDRNKLRVRVEVRGSATLPNEPFKVEQPIKTKGLFGRWSSVTVASEDFEKVGKMIAWRATLLEGDKELAQLRSFLWSAGNSEAKAETREE